MLKPLDVLVALKIFTAKEELSQMELARQLCISSSQVNSAIKQLELSLLLYSSNGEKKVIYSAMKELLISGLKYVFPTRLGALNRGMPIAYAAPPLNKLIVAGNTPDPELYEILVLIDALRTGRASERNFALKLIGEKFTHLP